MNKVNIALLDSGIDKYIRGYRKNLSYLPNDDWDLYGHGTECFNILKNNCINCNIDIIKILNSKGYTNIQILCDALYNLVDSDIDIINLSLSVIDNSDAQFNVKLYNICRELNKKNKIIVCSLKNRESEVSIPAVYNCVLGVRGGYFEYNSLYWYNPNKEIQTVANAAPILTRTINNKRSFFAGNSKATVVMSALVADLLQFQDKKDMKEILLNNAEKNFWCKRDIEETYSKWLNSKDNIRNVVDTKLLESIKNLIRQSKCFETEDLKQFLLGGKGLNLRLIDRYIYLINLIEHVKHINFKDDSIQLTDFSDIYKLCYSIQYKWKKFE
jgi:hypothetical protein